MNKLLFLSFLLLTAVEETHAQDTTQVANPVESGFNNLIENSNDYQGYKVVDYNELISLRNRTSEFVSNLNNQIISQKNTIDQQQDQIAQLRDDLDATMANLDQVNEEKDAITFLGFPFSKGSYKSLMWGIIAVLLLALLFFIYRYKKSHQQTVEAREKFTTTEKEFEAYKAKSLEKEQRLGRLLQDERNKSKEI